MSAPIANEIRIRFSGDVDKMKARIKKAFPELLIKQSLDCAVKGIDQKTGDTILTIEKGKT